MTAQAPSTNALTAGVVGKRLGLFLGGGALWNAFFVAPLVLGLLLKVAFDGMVNQRSLGFFAVVVGAYALAELLRRVLVHYGAIAWIRFWTMAEMLLRGAMLRAQVASGGRHSGPATQHAGAAMTRFRDDPQDVARYTDGWIDLTGAALFGLAAVAVMASIDPWLTVVVLLPVAAIALATRILGHWIAAAHRRYLERTSRLTASLRDIFAAHNTLRLYGARHGATAEIRRRAAERSSAAVVDRVLTESIRAASTSLSGIAVGIMLLVVADDLQAGRFSVGDLALFTSYLGYLTFLPRMIGYVLTRQRQTAVAFGRMGDLAADSNPANLMREFDLTLDRASSPAWPRPSIERVPLQGLEVHNLRYTFEDGAGLERADFSLGRGTLTVVTGHVGAGKTTLLRALLGLVPAEGDVVWNGGRLEDVGAFMVPPHSAYLPQSPRLFSDTLSQNIALGASGPEVAATIEMAGLSNEVAAMSAGSDTMVGPRGVRLSGGQRQRLGLARALHREPELLVLDDLSSALDADTEVQLWQRLRESGATIFAVSNRPIAIEAADQVLTMKNGRL